MNKDDFAPSIKELLTIASGIVEVSAKDNSLQSCSMRAALMDARKAYHENRGGDVLKALGSFWNLYLGWFKGEEKYVDKGKILQKPDHN